ncbi:MAG: hypothetical protein LBJ26_21980 [Paenibacillus sp.]|nr:hypothetical protein [Paenibacillus sp.]
MLLGVAECCWMAANETETRYSGKIEGKLNLTKLQIVNRAESNFILYYFGR